LGYDLPAAVADLVDNSVWARSRNIRVEFAADPGHSWLAVVDDGIGMTEDELDEAMRPGTLGPASVRKPGDLGRFGLGLKTASFSQARRLTVLTGTGHGALACRTWDLDLIGRRNQWWLLDTVDEDTLAISAQLGVGDKGTLVLWRDLDRAGEGRALIEGVARVGIHLAAVFGRFLASGSLSISVGGQNLTAWDPFLRRNTATQDLGTEPLDAADHAVRVTPFVLPHPSRLTETEQREAGGPSGWHAHQGFFVYRGGRLLTMGGWLRLPGLALSPHTRLARLAVEIDTDSDHTWQVDIRKSRVRPPIEVRPRLAELAELARQRSERVFRHRGAPLSRSDEHGRALSFVWQQKSRHGSLAYSVNRLHPVVAAALAGPQRRAVEGVLRLVEETVPIGLIAVEAAVAPDRTSQASLEGVDQTEVRTILASMVAGLPDDPGSRSAVIAALGAAEPFNRFPELVAEILRGPEDEHGSA
jgi:hypothetical protein